MLKVSDNHLYDGMIKTLVNTDDVDQIEELSDKSSLKSVLTTHLPDVITKIYKDYDIKNNSEAVAQCAEEVDDCFQNIMHHMAETGTVPTEVDQEQLNKSLLKLRQQMHHEVVSRKLRYETAKSDLKACTRSVQLCEDFKANPNISKWEKEEYCQVYVTEEIASRIAKEKQKGYQSQEWKRAISERAMDITRTLSSWSMMIYFASNVMDTAISLMKTDKSYLAIAMGMIQQLCGVQTAVKAYEGWLNNTFYEWVGKYLHGNGNGASDYMTAFIAMFGVMAGINKAIELYHQELGFFTKTQRIFKAAVVGGLDPTINLHRDARRKCIARRSAGWVRYMTLILSAVKLLVYFVPGWAVLKKIIGMIQMIVFLIAQFTGFTENRRIRTQQTLELAKLINQSKKDIQESKKGSNQIRNKEFETKATNILLEKDAYISKNDLEYYENKPEEKARIQDVN
ncbi:hypothetical protein CYMTET_41317 [Cymbomonas tetramitiformis]|uniref:Uncharacterized protein n=1 Tax=Cymbomonas tetramitiformis TaxID=36881 RepID=A0AAE0C6D4_9CHLO|nr:hypothetical protein CYMTET_41672 [Cymbomonas tetramitiformis]KAK3249241.1 hypothetical protein CYMTET_41317 [Cymbomonas tetramitiformis]